MSTVAVTETADATDRAPRRQLVAVPEAPVRDARMAEEGAALLLAGLGLDLTQPDLVDTPRRMAHALLELTQASAVEFTTFTNDEAYDELVLVRDIPLTSLCEHHVLPFTGVAHIGYLPSDRILGLSKFARMVELHARRPQTQERLTRGLANHLDELLSPRGLGVVIEAEHTCMSLRGARAPGSRTVTSALVGHLRDDPAARAEFLGLTRGR